MAEGVYPNGFPHPPPSLRARIGMELGVLAVLTFAFLYFAERFQIRSTALYVGMALVGFAMVGVTRRETRERIWGPPESPEFDRVRRCALNMSALTIPPVLVFLVWGILNHGIFNLNFVIALCLYLPWAMLQQTLFQFYLLGRLRALLPFASPLLLSVLNGIFYGLVHLPDVWVTVVTIFGGVFWSYSYHRDRYVLPIAISHALLGSTFYYWVYGRDLVDETLKRLAGQ